MAVTRVTNTRDGAAAIRYAFEEPSHKEGMDRVLMASGSNLDPNFAMQQMRDVWERFGKAERDVGNVRLKSGEKADGRMVEMYRVIQSFGLNELDPDNPEHIAIANDIGQTLANELYPDKQALIVTQADGEGGKLHNHILVNSLSFKDGKSIRGKEASWKTISDKSDEILERHGLKPIEREVGAINSTMAERKLREKGEYVWKDDLRGRIDSAMSNRDIVSQDDFVDYMRDEYDVGVRFRGKKGASYDFVDENGKKRTSRATALSNGGIGYNKDAITDVLDNNLDKLHQEALAENEQFDEIEEIEEKSFAVDSIGIDFGAELSAMGSKRKRNSDRPKKRSKSVSDLDRRLEATRQQNIINSAYDDAIVEDAHIEALQDNVQFDKQKAEREEKERQEAEAKRQREEQARQEQIEQQRKREDEQRQAQIEERYATLSRINKPFLLEADKHLATNREYLDYFSENYKDYKGKRNPLSQKEYRHSDIVDTISSRYKREQKEQSQEAHQEVVQEVAVDDGPEL